MRNVRSVFFGATAALALATAAYAQTDDCPSAPTVGEGSFPFSTLGATPSGDAPGCFDFSNDVWVRYMPSGTGIATVSLCGSLYDTALAIWTACPSGGGFQTHCNDDFCGLQSQIGGIAVTGGTPIWLRLHGFSTASGDGTCNISLNSGGPPANDHCPGTPVNEGSFPFDTTFADDTGPSASCGFGGDPGSIDVFFDYTATFTGTARASTCGTGHDTMLQVMDACPGNELACNDDSCGLQSQVTFNVTTGTHYYIRVSGYAGASGPGTLTIGQVTCGVGNDCCATADDVNGPGSLPFSTVGSTNDGSATCGASAASPDIWFRYHPASTGTVVIESCGSGYDTVLTAFDTCYGTELACNDDSCGLQSRITVPVTQGTPLLLRVAGFANQTGSGTLTFIEPTPPANDLCPGTDIGEGTFPFDTLAAGNEGPGASCGFGGDPGSNDVFFRYTPTMTGNAAITTCGSGYDTIIQVLDACNGLELACNDDTCGLQSTVNVAVTQNVPVIIRISGYFGARGTGTLGICIAQPFQAPAGAVLENEVCGGDSNGGCNNGPNYEPVAMNSVLHGTAWASAGTRDTDWFSFSANAGETITVCSEAEFAYSLYVLDMNCPPGFFAIGGGGSCGTSTLSFVPPVDGTYVIFFGTSSFDGTPCDPENVGNNYWFGLSNDGNCPPGGGCFYTDCSWSTDCCPFDFNGSGGTPDDADVTTFFAAWNAGDHCADVNLSEGTPDDADISTFFAGWNAGGC